MIFTQHNVLSCHLLTTLDREGSSLTVFLNVFASVVHSAVQTTTSVVSRSQKVVGCSKCCYSTVRSELEHCMNIRNTWRRVRGRGLKCPSNISLAGFRSDVTWDMNSFSIVWVTFDPIWTTATQLSFFRLGNLLDNCRKARSNIVHTGSGENWASYPLVLKVLV